jgi:hypothetical protein
MVDPAGMWPGAGSGPPGRRLATQARLASTTLLPLSAAFPVATPGGKRHPADGGGDLGRRCWTARGDEESQQ